MADFTSRTANPGLTPAVNREAIRASRLAARLALDEATRREHSVALQRQLAERFPQGPAPVVGFCWPVRGEPDLRPLLRDWCALGLSAALPVVDRERRTMRFHRWREGDPMGMGYAGIPEPQGTPEVRPGCLLVPMLAFDTGGYRLGYGAGYFDRTLADWIPRPLLIGIAFELSRVDSVAPQPHDIPVNWIATEAGVFAAA